MSLSGQQRKELQSALIDAFPNTASLEQMLTFELDKSLRAIAGEGSLQDIVFKLIQTANAQGWVEDLIRAAYKSNPGNQRLRIIVVEVLTNDALETTSNSPPESSHQPQKILILAAIPQGLRLDKEIREIEEAIRRATNRDLFEIRIRTAVRPQDIRRAIAEEQPFIVHFCGHGLEDGSLLLEDDGGNNKPVAPSSLASLFKLHADYVKCVLLNACYSEKPAVAISQYINYVIGMNNPIQDSAAIEFAKGFYDGVGYKTFNNQDVFQRAFDEGMVAIEMENLSQGSIPVLKKKLNANKEWLSYTSDVKQLLVETPRTVKTKCFIVLDDADIENLTSEEIETLIKKLRDFSKDEFIQLKRIYNGSIILELEGSEDGFKILKALHEQGKLTEILGLSVKYIGYDKPALTNTNSIINVFLSYSNSREDERLYQKLSNHLSLLENDGVISLWCERQISAGQERENQINERLNTASIVLLLVSSDFIASISCCNIVERAMQRHQSGQARVIPVLLRPVIWRDTSFGRLQALPTNGKPITEWGRKQDKAFIDIFEGIKTVAAELREGSKKSTYRL